MTWEELRDWCLSMPGSQETFPFAPEVSVFKASNGKMFALCRGAASPLAISIKVDPEEGAALRHEFDAATPAWHLNKRHWITLELGADLPDQRVRDLVEDSYDLVRPKRPRRVQEREKPR